MVEIRRIVMVLAALTALGTCGYMVLEGWGVFDALYMTVITLTTVGYSEVYELSATGRVFTMLLLVIGLGVFLFGVVQIGEVVVRAELTSWLGKRKMHGIVAHMQDHFIVCGFGRFGRGLCEELAGRNMQFVVIEQDPDALEPCKERGWPYLVGDATEDTVLEQAGIDRARSIACALPTDASNLYVVLTARLTSKTVQILSRASTEKDAEKLRRAGADRVVSLYGTAATKMAQLMATPKLEDFIEVFTARGNAIDLVEIQVAEDAPYAGRTLAEAGFRDRGILIVGIRRRNGELIVPPSAAERLVVGESMIALGDVAAVRGLLQS